MQKDFDAWDENKKQLSESDDPAVYFKTGEVWWAFAGINVGYEQNGKGEQFRRPVLILKKFNQHLASTVPLTTQLKHNPYYISCMVSDGLSRMAIISQCKAMSSKRFSQKIGFVERWELQKIKDAVRASLDNVFSFQTLENPVVEPEGHL